jgi:hypothetical protein
MELVRAPTEHTGQDAPRLFVDTEAPPELAGVVVSHRSARAEGGEPENLARRELDHELDGWRERGDARIPLTERRSAPGVHDEDAPEPGESLGHEARVVGEAFGVPRVEKWKAAAPWSNRNRSPDETRSRRDRVRGLGRKLSHVCAADEQGIFRVLSDKRPRRQGLNGGEGLRFMAGKAATNACRDLR